MSERPFIFCISGVKNSGKTTLITKLLPVLIRRGLKVATIKHDGHDFEADVPGTDTYAHLQAGAYGTAVFSSQKFMAVKREPVDETRLWEFFPEADIILMEGFKNSPYPKMELVRKGNSVESVCPRENMVAVLTDFPLESGAQNCSSVPILPLNDIEAIADEILLCRYIQTQLTMVILAGGLSSRMGTDKADLRYQSRTFLEHQIEKGREMGISEILVSGYRGEHCTGQVVPDRLIKKGPLGGMEACLRQAKHEKCLVLSVDCPLISVQELKNLIKESQKTKFQATILQHGEKQEPLMGIYSSSLANNMEEEIQKGKGSVFAMLRKIGYSTYKSLGDEWQFQNINDISVYQKLLQEPEIGTLQPD